MITGLNHVSIVVPDLDAAVRRLSDVYGLTAGEPRINAEQGVRLVWIDLGNARLELTEPTRPDSPVAGFLQRNPRGGIHHVCLDVAGMDEALRVLGERGVRALGDGAPRHNVNGDRIAFLHPGDFLGALVELEEHR